MSEEQPRDELAEYYENSRKPLFRIPKHPIGRLGCAAVLVLWFGVMLLPCAMFYLASGNNITISHNNIPEPEQHPLLEIQLIMEIKNRGFRFSSSGIASQTESQLCINNSVTYLLWASDSSATDSQYCQCYEAANGSWQFTEQYAGQCESE